MRITVLNYENYSVDIVTVDNEVLEKDWHCDVQSYLVNELGYTSDLIHWMVNPEDLKTEIPRILLVRHLRPAKKGENHICRIKCICTGTEIIDGKDTVKHYK